MRQATATQPPPPVLEKMRWPVPTIWLIPVIALIAAGYYAYDYFQDRRIPLTVTFADATGLRPGETTVSHLGVPIGQVDTVELSADQNRALVHLRLFASAGAFAKQGALFWIVRPEVSAQSVSGLGTIASGPFISAVP